MISMLMSVFIFILNNNNYNLLFIIILTQKGKKSRVYNRLMGALRRKTSEIRKQARW